mmetsp:Transcript_154507/g.296622  ORF Transcript_154507/g.296622 Transcript_154507/m.296622 type:complete len:205 (+) Transcript_154507:692-1306(+)
MNLNGVRHSACKIQHIYEVSDKERREAITEGTQQLEQLRNIETHHSKQDAVDIVNSFRRSSSGDGSKQIAKLASAKVRANPSMCKNKIFHPSTAELIRNIFIGLQIILCGASIDAQHMCHRVFRWNRRHQPLSCTLDFLHCLLKFLLARTSCIHLPKRWQGAQKLTHQRNVWIVSGARRASLQELQDLVATVGQCKIAEVFPDA